MDIAFDVSWNARKFTLHASSEKEARAKALEYFTVNAAELLKVNAKTELRTDATPASES